MTYDANGNTLSYDVDGSGPILKRELAYDMENRPVSLTPRNPDNTTAPAARFAYGPDGARSLKVFGTTYSHYFAGEEIVTNAANTPTTLTSTLHPDVKRVIDSSVTATPNYGAIDFVHRDRKASTRITLRYNITGTTRSDYGPFGQPLALTSTQVLDGSTVITGRGYISQRYDAEANANLQYLNARYYDPNLGRFLTPDWWDVTMAGVDINRYAYSSNDPVNGSDPSGHSYYVSRETGSLVSTNCSNCGSSTVGGAYAAAGLGSNGQGNGNYSYSWANFAGTYTIEKNYFTGNMVGNAYQRDPSGTPVSGAAIAAANASAMRHNGGGYSTYHAGLGAGQVGPNMNIDSKVKILPDLTSGLGDAVIKYINIGPDIYALVGDPKSIPTAVQDKIRAGLAKWGYGRPPSALTAGVSIQFALFAKRGDGFQTLGQYLSGAEFSAYKTTLFVASGLTGARLNNTIAHEFFHYYERSIQGINSSEAKAGTFGDSLYPE